MHQILMRIRTAIPPTQPISPVERRIIVALILMAVVGTWCSIWAVRYVKAKEERPPAVTGTRFVSTVFGDGAAPVPRPEAGMRLTGGRCG